MEEERLMPLTMERQGQILGPGGLGMGAEQAGVGLW